MILNKIQNYIIKAVKKLIKIKSEIFNEKEGKPRQA